MRKRFVLFVVLIMPFSHPAWAQWQQGGRALRGSVSSGVTSIVMNAERQTAQKGINALVPVVPAGISLEDPFLRGIFQAREDTAGETNLFSGTVFQTEYNGKPEVYVAVAAHALESGQYVLGKEFIGDIYVGDGKFKPVRMKIVQHSAPSMLDVAIGIPLEGGKNCVHFRLVRKNSCRGKVPFRTVSPDKR